MAVIERGNVCAQNLTQVVDGCPYRVTLMILSFQLSTRRWDDIARVQVCSPRVVTI